MLVIVLLGAGSHRVVAQSAPQPAYELVWSDEFSKSGWPDPRNWTYERGFVRNQELQWYQADNARVENGIMECYRGNLLANVAWAADTVGKAAWVRFSNRTTSS